MTTNEELVEDYWKRDRVERARLRERPVWFRLRRTISGRDGPWHRVMTELHHCTWIEGPVGRCDCGTCTSWMRARDHVEVEFTRDEPTEALCIAVRKEKRHPVTDNLSNPYAKIRP